ncbi:hypothetical protein ACFC00_30715 [Streptomyces adustus]|uniref:hypothetical protein n=1 Tax=Streptomyces adustus TaxID=1609272 RepID=UPI0035D83236
MAITATALTLDTDTDLGDDRTDLWTVTAVTGVATILAVAGGLRHRRREGAPVSAGGRDGIPETGEPDPHEGGRRATDSGSAPPALGGGTPRPSRRPSGERPSSQDPGPRPPDMEH